MSRVYAILVNTSSKQNSYIIKTPIVLIGKKPSSHLVLNHDSISNEHCSIEIVNNEIYLRDTSTYGCRVNNKFMINQIIKLKEGDVIQFGKDTIKYELRLPDKDSEIDKSMEDSQQINNKVNFQGDKKISLVSQSKTSNRYNAEEDNEIRPKHNNPNYQSHMTFNDKTTEDIIILKERLKKETQDNIRQQNDYESLLDEYTKLNMKFNSLLIYSSSIQKRNDELELERQGLIIKLSEFTNNDMIKSISSKEAIIKTLEKDLEFYKKENLSLRSFQVNNNESNAMNRLNQLIESYLLENKQLKRINEELINKDNYCNKKWNELMKENESNKEKISLLAKASNDQKEEFITIITNYDHKLIDALQVFPKILKENNEEIKKIVAANYLLEQINYFMEERRKELVIRQELQEELSLFNHDKELLVEHINTIEKYINNNEILSIKAKNEELEDTIYQQNIVSSYSKIVELEESIILSRNECYNKDKIIDGLNNKLKTYFNNKDINIINENEMFSSLTKAIREKDLQIINLKAQATENNVTNLITFQDNKQDNKVHDNQSYYDKSVISYNPSQYIYKVENITN